MEPNCTIQMNAMGHLHIWAGNVEPKQTSKYNYTVNGNDSDLYFQADYDVQAILDYLTPEDREDVDNGWTIRTWIPEEYFD